MTSIINYFLGSKPQLPNIDKNDVSVSVAESVTAGALANSLCAEPGASKFFKGGIVAYSIASKKEILGVDIKFAESNNFANPFTTSEMARSVAKMFNSRIGLATTGYSLPITRPENKETNECALNITKPYAYICLYDRLTDTETITKVEYVFDPEGSITMQRASVQVRVALAALKFYNEYAEKIKDNN
jgi:PncC family amidohydrolase